MSRHRGHAVSSYGGFIIIQLSTSQTQQQQKTKKKQLKYYSSHCGFNVLQLSLDNCCKLHNPDILDELIPNLTS